MAVVSGFPRSLKHGRGSLHSNYCAMGRPLVVCPRHYGSMLDCSQRGVLESNPGAIECIVDSWQLQCELMLHQSLKILLHDWMLTISHYNLKKNIKEKYAYGTTDNSSIITINHILMGVFGFLSFIGTPELYWDAWALLGLLSFIGTPELYWDSWALLGNSRFNSVKTSYLLEA